MGDYMTYDYSDCWSGSWAGKLPLPTIRSSWARTAPLAGQATGRFCSPGIFEKPSSGSIRGSPLPSWTRLKRRWRAASPPPPLCRSTRRSTPSSGTAFPLRCSAPAAELSRKEQRSSTFRTRKTTTFWPSRN